MQACFCPIFLKTKLASIFSLIFSRGMWKKQFHPFKIGSVQYKISYFSLFPHFSSYFPPHSFFSMGIILGYNSQTKICHLAVTILYPLKFLHVAESTHVSRCDCQTFRSTNHLDTDSPFQPRHQIAYSVVRVRLDLLRRR